jgi:hypothetical protein
MEIELSGSYINGVNCPLTYGLCIDSVPWPVYCIFAEAKHAVPILYILCVGHLWLHPSPANI